MGEFSENWLLDELIIRQHGFQGFDLLPFKLSCNLNIHSCSISFSFHITAKAFSSLSHILYEINCYLNDICFFLIIKVIHVCDRKFEKYTKGMKKKKSTIIPSSANNHCFFLMSIIPVLVVLGWGLGRGLIYGKYYFLLSFIILS